MSEATTAPLRLAIVMPAFEAAHLLPRSLGTAVTAGADEVIVVDPGSSDATAQAAEELGARVLRLGRRAGPAEARNAGVELTDAEIVLFVDSDCVLHADVVERVRRAFTQEPGLVSLTGSYDDTPPEKNFASLYMNLRHHFVHQGASRENASFWAVLGAVRRSAFLEAGGFDAELFPRPMIEDIELAGRLKKLGATHLDPSLHATHLKRWTLGSVITTDIFSRAIPWSKLILRSGHMPDDLNTARRQRIAALLAPLTLLALPASLGLAAWDHPRLGFLFLLVPLVSVFLQVDLISFFARRLDPPRAFGAWLFHQVHLSYSGIVFALCSLRHRLQPSWLSSDGGAA